jgi:hypothetical protein
MLPRNHARLISSARSTIYVGKDRNPGAAPRSHHLNVFLTVDTEVYPITSAWRENRLRRDIDRDIYGRIETGEYGLTYQLSVLQKYGLKASFFVESLFALSANVGEAPLRRIVREIQAAGQEVQMHLHPEWVPELPADSAATLRQRESNVLSRFSASDQAVLIRAGLGALKRSGAQNICAFRAGDYAANFDTLRALHNVGIQFDSSYNYCYLNSLCGLRTGQAIVQPMRMDGVWEIPISFFRDWPGHYRHAQLRACSSAEIIHALEKANSAGWWSFVIVSHSFECLKNRWSRRPVSVQPRVVARFEALCRYLDRNRDRFSTKHFIDIDSQQIPLNVARPPLKGRTAVSLLRVVEQLGNRLT